MLITLIPGDGIGPEVTNAARRCIDALTDVEWTVKEAGEGCIKDFGTPLSDDTIRSIKKTRFALKGPITTPVGGGFRSVNVELRKRLDLYANVRPAKIYEGVRSRFSSVDLVVIRENTEDLYSGIEFSRGSKAILLVEKLSKERIRHDSAISIKSISTFASRRIARFAFDYATRNRRKKVTAVHKANIMKYTDGLFLNEARKAARKYQKIEFEEIIVDNMAMQLVQKPELYDVILCPNLYGDILSDLCAGLVGGLGIAPSANIGKYAVFEPVHGSAPKHAGKNRANPTAAILSGAMMLRHIGKTKEANILENAVSKVIREGRHVTYDINPSRHCGTKEMTDAIIRKIKA